MFILFVLATIFLSLWDLKNLKKSPKKDVIVYSGMIIVAVLLYFWYTLSGNNGSIAEMLMQLFNVQG